MFVGLWKNLCFKKDMKWQAFAFVAVFPVWVVLGVGFALFCLIFWANLAKSLSVVRIQLKKMCHLADESMTPKADFSATPDSKIDAEGFPSFWFFLSRSRLLHMRNRVFLNAGPKILFWSLPVNLSCCCFSPSLFSCHCVPKGNASQGSPWTSST